MPSRRLPNSMPAVIRTLKAARDAHKNTPVAADRAISADHWTKLDDSVPASFLNRLLKEASDVDLALAAQAPLSSQFSQVYARLTLFVSHFHQVLDMGIARGTFAAGARGYYGRDIGSTTIPDLSNQTAVMEAAELVVTGEAARFTAEAAAHVPMALPSAAEVATLRTQFLSLRNQREQAVVKTDREREELMALYTEAQILAVDICDTVEFFYRKDPDAGSRRTKCERWGVVYHFEPGEQPPTPPADPNPPAPPAPNP
jgi:hypothetical protein